MGRARGQGACAGQEQGPAWTHWLGPGWAGELGAARQPAPGKVKVSLCLVGPRVGCGGTGLGSGCPSCHSLRCPGPWGMSYLSPPHKLPQKQQLHLATRLVSMVSGCSA